MFFCINGKVLRAALALILVCAAVLGILASGVFQRQAQPVLAPSGYGFSTVVIDPGHGGEDGGAVSASGILESSLNLEISQRLEALLLFFGLPVIMTRETEEIDYPEDAATTKARKTADTKARVALIESIDQALLVSIHQNFYPGTSPSGAQVLFAPTEGSQALAERMQQNFLLFLDPDNRRTAVPIQDNIYIMNHVSCPAVLVECGFLSNPSELEKLCDADYQKQLTAVLTASILSIGGSDESENDLLLYGVRE